MSGYTNHLGQPVGFPVPGWTPRERPPHAPMQGRFCRVESLDPARHGKDLFEANRDDVEGRNFTYLGYGPFERFEDYAAWMAKMAPAPDPHFHAVIDLASGRAVGVASLMRMDPASGSIEVGHINYSPRLQRKPAATEAMYLMMRRVFDELGYRRYEWKCDSFNAPSRAAAERLGFRFEGIFRQHMVYKGRNRDSCWFSILDSEWPSRKAAFERWLDPANFDAAGRQRKSLAALRG
ncbi:MAG TPA: GNAT family protein [Candidatus Cybelea sp.]|nr:GNAT family protein [Candidatus Cybelea sp.]